MTPEEHALYVAVYAAVLGTDPQRDHARAHVEACRAVKNFRTAPGP